MAHAGFGEGGAPLILEAAGRSGLGQQTVGQRLRLRQERIQILARQSLLADQDEQQCRYRERF